MIDLDVRRLERPGADLQVTFVHGALDRAANFVRAAREVLGYDVILYTRRGYGPTAGEAAASIDVHVADLIKIVGTKPTVLIGHSYGSLIALSAAVERPNQIVAVGAFEPPMPWLPWWPQMPAFEDPASAVESFFFRIAGQEVWETLPDGWKEERRREGPALVADFDSTRAGPTFEAENVLSPVTAAFGSESTDEFKRAAVELAALVHDGKVTCIEGAGHGAHLSHPVEFGAWVNEVAATAAG